MNMKAVLVGVLAIGLAASPALAKKARVKAPPAPACVKDKVLVALEMRMMQTELVVGALSCQLTPRYNEFVTAYKPDLMGAHRTLLKWFGREGKMEDYKSKTANEASQRSLRNLAEYCAYTTALYDKLLQPQKLQLAEFVQTEPSAATHGFPVCGAPPTLVTASALPTDGRRIPKPRFKPDVTLASHRGGGKAHKPHPDDAYVPPAPAAAAAPATATP